VAWIERDGFMDREEANHVLRALETYDAMFGSVSAPASLRRLLSVRIDQPKVWYGWPSYVPEAVAWRVRGKTYDNGVLADLLCLAAEVTLARALGRWLDPRAAPLMVLFHALLPGALVWAHFFNVTLAVMALTYLALLAVLRAGAWDHWPRALMAGLACAAVTVAKSTTVFLWAPLAAVTAGRALMARDGRTGRVRNLAVFSLGLVPAAVHYGLAWEPLQWWATRVREIYAFESGWASLRRGAWMRPHEVLLPLHIALSVLGLIAMLSRRESRWRGAALALWPIPSLVGVFLTGGFPGTTRDVLPLVVAPALLASLAYARLPRASRLAVLWTLLGFGCLFVPINFSRRFDDTAVGRHLAWLRPYIDGTPNIRLRPHPPVLQATIAALTANLGSGACSCLPAAPHPVSPGDPRPTVLLDHSLIGPESLIVASALAGEKLPWNLGYAPYALPTPLFRTTVGCASAVLLGEPPFQAEYFGVEEASIAAGRELLRDWGEGTVLGTWPGFGTLTVRRSTEPPLCRISNQEAVDVWLGRWTAGGGEGRYYSDYLRLLLTGGDSATLTSSMASVRQAADERRRRLQAGDGVSAALFGEEGVVRGVLASLGRMRVAAAADSTETSPDILWLRRGSALPLGLPPLKLGDGAFALQWGPARFPSRVAPGGRLIGTLAVTNRGDESWPSLREARGPAYSVRLGCRILDAAGNEVPSPLARGDLPRSVAPGMETSISISIDAPRSPGTYRLECDLLQEQYAWFSPHGNPKVTVDFTTG
jgi:hypothetical protein